MQKKHYRFKKLKIEIIKKRGKKGRREEKGGKKRKLHRTTKAQCRGRG